MTKLEYSTIGDCFRRIADRRIAHVFLAVLLGLAPAVAAQSPADSVARHDDRLSATPPRAWLSLGLGAGSSYVGDLVARGAASIAVNRVVVLTLEEASLATLGGDRSVSTTNFLIGAQSSDPRQFVFLSAGLAMTKCGSGCLGQSGIAIDGGLHIGGRHAGIGFVGFVVRTPETNRCHCNSGDVSTSMNGVAVTLDVGWFGR
jgi:hypothetical protein